MGYFRKGEKRTALTGPQSLFLKICAGLLALEIGIGTAVYARLLTGNLSPSAPTGLYLPASEKTASFVSFCLSRRHAELAFYGRFCSPDTPDGMQILKRIAARASDGDRAPEGDLIVAGQVELSIDSALLGPIRPAQITGYWRHIGP